MDSQVMLIVCYSLRLTKSIHSKFGKSNLRSGSGHMIQNIFRPVHEIEWSSTFMESLIAGFNQFSSAFARGTIIRAGLYARLSLQVVYC